MYNITLKPSLVVGLFDGIPILRRIEESKWLCEYNLVAELGGASEKFRKRNDKLLTTANMSHVTREQILRATSYFDAKHRHDLVNNVIFYLFEFWVTTQIFYRIIEKYFLLPRRYLKTQHYSRRTTFWAVVFQDRLG